MTLCVPEKGTKGTACGQVKLADVMTGKGEGTHGSVKTYKAGELPISQIEFADGDKTVIVTASGTNQKQRCDLTAAGTCAAVPSGQAPKRQRGARPAGGRAKPESVPSPDKTKEAFI